MGGLKIIVSQFEKRKLFTFFSLGALDAPWKLVQPLFTLHSIGHSGDISICFTAS